MWNGLCPNDIQIRVFNRETWLQAVENETEVYMIDDYDIWKCPKCSNVYSFKKNHLDKMFVIEGELKEFNSCMCGKETDFKFYVAYSDVEMDKFTFKADTANEMPMPSRDLWSCNKCNRFFVKEYESEIIVAFVESNYWTTNI